MKTNLKKLFSFSASDTEYLNEKQDKIELLSCPRNGIICQEHLAVVNKCYVESEHYRKERDFDRSIDTLKSAFYKTTELSELPCSKCASLFRLTITESMEDMHKELGKMSNGIFSKKRYQTSYQLAGKVLKEFENVTICNTLQLNESKRRYIGNYPQKNVS
jgi:hypothetical protein